MGMFDHVRCYYPLPDAEAQDAAFQTKDLACALDDYSITREGRLVLHAKRYESQEDEASPLGFRLVVVQEWDECLLYHGDLRFYDRLEGEWYEYVARFSAGKLQWVQRVNNVPPSPTFPGT